ncbi:MAG: DUF7544 domain-containing protein [Planctomycetota bacterium]|jgi:hypothetical protein
MAPQQTGISVIDPISPAIDRVKLILFQPFDLAKWFVIGFCAWLAYLGQRGFNFNFRFPLRGSGHQTNLPAQLQEVFGIHLPLIIAIGAALFVLGIAIMIVCLWLSSRGHFMFLHCVALNRSEVKLPWYKFREQGNSLFLFRLAVGIIFFLCLVLFIGAIVLFIALFRAGNVRSTVSVVVAIVLLMFVLLPVGICFALILKFTRDFVVPLMYLRTCTCVDAWHEFWPLLTSNKGGFTLYILFQIVIALAIGAIVAAAGLLTCCCGFVLLAIPYIGTVLMLPLLIFSRAYSLLYIRQFGPRFDVFGPEISQTEAIVPS